MGKKIKIRKKDYKKFMELLATANNNVLALKKELQMEQSETERLQNCLEKSQQIVKNVATASNVFEIAIAENGKVRVSFYNGEVDSVEMDFSNDVIIKEAIYESIVKRILGQREFETVNTRISAIARSENMRIANLKNKQGEF